MAVRANEKIFSGPVLRLQPDRRLVALTGEGSEAAMEEIVRRYRPALVRYARSIVGADRAEDVVQDSLAKAVPAIGGGIEELHLRPWLYTIVRNTGLNALRDAGPTHLQLDENHDGVEQPQQALERSEQMRSLVRELRGLPDAQREALVKREMEGRSHDEIGAELGVSTGAARQLIFRARDALRAGLGSLVPMPLLRYLVDGGGDGGAVGVTAATGGGALAAKAAVAIVATGAVVGGGLAVRHAEHHSHGSPPPPVSREAALPIAPAGGADAAAGAAREVADQHRDDGSRGSDGHEGGQDGERHHGRHRGGDNGGDNNPGSSDNGSGGPSGSPGSGDHGDSGSSGKGSNLSGGDGGSHHGGGDDGESHGGSEGGTGGSQAADTTDADSNSGSGGGSSPGGADNSGESGGGSDGSGSGSSGADGGGDGSAPRVSRDSGGGDGLSGVTDQQSKEER